MSWKKIYLIGGGVAALAIAGFGWAFLSPTKIVYRYSTAARQKITETVSASGVIKAANGVDLSFERSGIIRRINVNAGDSVKAGEVLATLSNGVEAGQVAEAKAALETADANYQRVLAGASGEDIAVSRAAVAAAEAARNVAEKNLDAVKSQQAVLAANAQSALLNSTLSVVPNPANSSIQSPVISGVYQGTAEGQYVITLYQGAGVNYTINGLETGPNGSIPVNGSTVAPLGTRGLLMQFPSGAYHAGDSWTVTIPNTQALNYVSNYNGFKAALQTQNQALTAAEGAVDAAATGLNQAQAALALKQSAARPVDVAAARAGIASAQAALQAAAAAFGKTLLRTPIAGTVSRQDGTIGGLAAPNVPVLSVIDESRYQLVVYVSEIDVAKIKVGDPASVTIDAYGAGLPFPAAVIAVEPGLTAGSGTNGYKVTVQFTYNDNRIKEGMTANAVITTAEKDGALTVPEHSVIQKNGRYVVLRASSSGQPMEQPVTLGIHGDGVWEITSGLAAGDQVVTYGGASR